VLSSGEVLRVRFKSVPIIMNYHYIICVFLSILLISCNVESVTNKTEKMMSAKIDQDCDFSKIDLNVPSGNTICSPVVTDKQIMQGVTGIFINMPDKIPFKDIKEIKICMLTIMDSTDSKKHGGSELLVLKSDLTNKVFNGRFINDDREAPLPEDFDKDEEDLDMIEEGYFNFNLNTYLDFDRKPGVYHLYVTMGPFSSNVVTFEIMPDK